MRYEEKLISEIATATQDFQKRAMSYEDNSRWVKDDIINYIPYKFLCHKRTLGNLLDAGGGTGYLPYYLTSKIPAESISVIDASINMLQKAKVRLPQARMINASIESYCSKYDEKFDTILARQIFHYVDDVNAIILLLKEKLKENGVMYVGQFVVCDEEADRWHSELIKKISQNRKRSFIFKNFLDLFEDNGFSVIKCDTTNYEENIKDFYSRKTNEDISYDMLLRSTEVLLNERIIKNLSVRMTENNLFFTVQFCHLLLKKRI